MGVEIERKFLVSDDGWRAAATAQSSYLQGYLAADPVRTVRVRLADGGAYLTIKGERRGISRAEFEYAIPVGDAERLMGLCGDEPVAKTRWRVPVGDHLWEVDEFLGANAPLVVAEVELDAEDEVFQRPDWLGREVSMDHRYSNSYLSAHPWSTWPADER
jgi:adenylate cyclase